MSSLDVERLRSGAATGSFTSARPVEGSVADALVAFCERSGVCATFAVSGGGSGILYSALCQASFELLHCRREDSCVYAAAEASLASGRPAVVCVTSGEAVSKAMSGIASARAEGASVLVLSGYSNPGQFGRAAIQCTDGERMPTDFYRAGSLLDFGRALSSTDELPWVFNRLTLGFQRPEGFCAHLALPRDLQAAPFPFRTIPSLRVSAPAPSPAVVDYCAVAFSRESFAVVAGFGARRCRASVAALVDLTQARAFTTPRAKGLLDGPCIGIGGTNTYYEGERPERLLVLGTRLGEASCGWDEALLPKREIVHVDVDPSCFGASYLFPTYGVHAEIDLFLRALLPRLHAAKTFGAEAYGG